MSETIYAIVDSTGIVINTIVADKSFIDSLPAIIASDEIDSGYLDASNQYVDVTSVNPRPGFGWKRLGKGKFEAPPAPEPVDPDPDVVTPS